MRDYIRLDPFNDFETTSLRGGYCFWLSVSVMKHALLLVRLFVSIVLHTLTEFYPFVFMNMNDILLSSNQ